MAARAFSALTFASRFNALFATEQRAAPRISDQRGECNQRECDVQQVDHVILG